jgi:predicted lactoylglutathione lyase
MKTRTLFTVILATLLVSSLSLSQEKPSQEPPTKEQPTDPNSTENVLVTEIITTRYFPADELSHLIMNIFRTRNIYSDRRSNRLIIKTTKQQLNEITAMIKKLDVADSNVARTQQIQNVIHRIYMFEIPSRNVDMKPFSMILQTSPPFSSAQLLNAAKDKNLKISGFHLSNERDRERQNDILIQGQAASNETIKQMVESIPESGIKELKWDDSETFTKDIAAAQYTQLPEQIQKHIINFLGKDIQTVGYWFGSSSVPGEIEAPIGPWTLNLSLEPESDNTLELRIEVEAPREMYRFDRQLGRDRDDEILSNTMKTKIGKPIIIGYNRQSYGTRKMGAMVILLEADTVQLSESENKIR